MSTVQRAVRAATCSAILFLFLGSTICAHAAIRPYRGNPKPTPTPVGPPMVEEQIQTRRPTVIRPPDNDTYVGAVDYRFLRESDLQRRVNRLILQSATMDQIRDTESAADLREELIREIEEQVLYEWAQSAVLAVHAEQQGIQVTPAEMQQMMSELVETRETNPEAWTAIKAIGIEWHELQGYVRDAILAEKLVSREMQKFLSEEDLKFVYQRMPGEFATPSQIELNFICMAMQGNESVSERRRLYREMENWRKKAAKSRDFLKFAREEFANPELGRLGGYYGWASPKSLPKYEELDKKRQTAGYVAVRADDRLVKEVYALDQGEVSDVLTSPMGMYVFELIDRRDASGLNYESARPRVESAVFMTFRDKLVNKLLTEHTVYLNPSGLDFDAIAERASKDPETLRAEAERRREERLMQIAEEKFEEYDRKGLLDRAVREDSPAAISEDSLQILKKEATRYPERYATPLPN